LAQEELTELKNWQRRFRTRAEKRLTCTQQDQVMKLVDSAFEQFSRVDLILNNAGIMPLSPMDRLSVD